MAGNISLCFLVSPSDLQHQLVIKEVSSEWSPSLDQEDTEPLHIKEEHEKFCTELLNGIEETDITINCCSEDGR